MLNQFHCYGINDWKRKLEKHGFKVIKHQYYVRKKTLMLWDKMAMQLFLLRIFRINADKKYLRKYESRIRKLYLADIQPTKYSGAGLFIHCRKI